MVTNKQRRKQVAHASAQRRQERDLHRQSRRRAVRLIAAALAVAIAVVALAVWIVLHDADSGTTRAAQVATMHHLWTAPDRRTLRYPGE